MGEPLEDLESMEEDLGEESGDIKELLELDDMEENE